MDPASTPVTDRAAASRPTRFRRTLAALLGVTALALLVTGAIVGLGLTAIVASRPAPEVIRGADVATATRGASADGYSVWARNDDGLPVRWDPCSPIELVHATHRAPEGATDDLDAAVATLRELSGLDLVVTTTTDERPSGDRAPFLPDRYGTRWAPVLVAWVSPWEAGLPLRDTDRGIAIPIAVGAPGQRTYVSGQVVLNADRVELVAGTADRADSWGATLLHELVHVLGLGHVDDPDQLMYVYPGEGPVELGPGDRAGLRAVGPATGCLEVPSARPVEVADPPR